MKIIYTAIILFISSLAAEESISSKIQQEMDRVYEYHGFSGVLLFAEKDQIKFHKAYGQAERDWTIANTKDTKFLIASVSKQFTSMMVMQLVSEGKVALDSPITAYIKDFPADPGKQLSIHRLLSHTAGLPHYSGFQEIDVDIWAYAARYHPVSDYVQLIGKMKLESTPGTKYRYSSMGYVLLGYLIEQVTGQSFNQVLQERICRPIGLKNTGFSYSDEIVPMLAKGYEYRTYQTSEGKYQIGYRKEPFRDQANKYSTGGIHSTTEDLFKWTRALQGDLLLSNPFRKKIFTPVMGDYGYGWRIRPLEIGSDDQKRTFQIIEHTGGLSGYRSIVTMVNEGQYTIIILSNGDQTDTGGIRNTVLQIASGLPTTPIISGPGLSHEGDG